MHKHYSNKNKLIESIVQKVIQEIKAYHGSGARFKKFDSQFNRTGEGSASFGPGHYFTGSKQIGKDYANEHGTSRMNIPKIIYKGYEHGDSYFQGIKLYNDLDSIVNLKKFNEANGRYLVQYIIDQMESCDRKQDFIRKIYSQVLRAVKSKENYNEDHDWYDYVLNKVVNLLKDNIEEKRRSLYQVEIPNDEKFADWRMEVPEEWVEVVEDFVSRLDNGDEYIDNLNEYLIDCQDRYGKITIKDLYYSLNNMDYSGILGDNVFKWLLRRYGYVGVKYPSGTNFSTSSTKEGDVNYTVFDDDKIKITNRWDY